jgi:membrane fusion protein (multidrug efflux system)
LNLRDGGMTHQREDEDWTERDALQTLRPAQRTSSRAAGGSTDAASGVAAERTLEWSKSEEPAHDRSAHPDAPHAEPRGVSEPQTAGETKSAPRGRSRRRAIVYGVALLAVVAGAGGYLYLDHDGRFQSTDDAFFAARQSSIAPKVGGYLSAVPVTDNQHVAAGALIARIDNRDYRVALAQAEAQVGVAQAGIRTIDSQIAAQNSQIAAAQAQVDQAEAALTFAGQQADRYQRLAQTGSGSVETAQQSSSQLNQQRASVAAAKATLAGAQRQIDTLNSQRASAVANLGLATAQADQARLNLSYTAVTAAEPGRVANLTAAVGQLAQPGAGLAMFVPDDVWVVANFKETQLDAMLPGQPVEITVDAYPDRILHGHVASIQPGSGTAFSLLPAENATGNYVKIVQRVPVKIVVDDLPADLPLGPGVSVVPTVRVNPAPSLYERLKAGVQRLTGRA